MKIGLFLTAMMGVAAISLRAQCPQFSYGPITVHQDVFHDDYAAGVAWAWTPTGPMHYGQSLGTATRLLDGRVLAAGTAAEVFNPADGSWTLTVGGPNILNKGHQECAAVLLPDGKVLLAGGFNGNGTTTNAQIFDPANNSWTDAAPMHIGHGGLTLTLLPNGTVLACGTDPGGLLPKTNSPSAELYDPATGTWTATGEMVFPRHYHTATLLPDGKVLIAGGRYGDGNAGGWGTNAAQAELYDPATGTFALTGSMVDPRWGGTATLLTNGMVLVAGGLGTTACDLYNPATGTWSATGSLNRTRLWTAAALLPNGEVLVAGGYGWEGPPNNPIGGAESTTELYDPASGTWTFDGRMGSARSGAAAAVLSDGRVLVAGGDLTTPMPDDLSYYETQSDAEIYDPAMGGRGPYAVQIVDGALAQGLSMTGDGFIYGQLSFRGTNSFTVAITDANGCAAAVTYNIVANCPILTMSPNALLRGTVGIPYSQTLTTAGGDAPYTYALVDGTLPGGLSLSLDGHITGTPSTEGVFNFTIASADTNACNAVQACSISIVNCPGLAMHSATLPIGTFGSNYLYNLSAGKWTMTGPIPDGFWAYPTATLLTNGTVLFVGGGRAQTLLYDPTSRTWRYTGSMSTQRILHTAAALSDGRVLVAGGLGANGQTLASAEIYDPATETWTLTGSLSEARTQPIAALIPSGKVMLNGGVLDNFDNPYTHGTELFDPATGTWTSVASSPSLHFGGKLVALPSGKVVAAGGSSWSCDTYDPVADVWTAGPFCDAYMGTCATVLPDGRVLVVGGEAERQTVFDANLNQAIGIGPLHYNREYAAAGLLDDGEVLVAGGIPFDDNSPPTASAELFNPSTGTWRDAAPMNLVRETHAGVVLKDGSFLVAGGAEGPAETYDSVPDGGVPPYTFYVTGGSLPPGMSMTTNGIIGGIPLAVQTNSFTVTMVDANGCTGSADFSLSVQPGAAGDDSVPPTLALRTPVNKALFKKTLVTISGTAADAGVSSKGRLAGVLYSVNGAPKQLARSASKYKTWNAAVTLQPGWNTCVAQAFDSAGNSSVVSSNIYFSGDTTAVAGTYNGLFYEMEGAQPKIVQRSAGAILNMSVSIYGPFSGKVYCAGQVYTIAGTFDLTGDSVVTIPRPEGADLVVTLKLDWTGHQRQVTGTVLCVAEGWTAPLSADLNGYGKGRRYTGPKQFTMALARTNVSLGSSAAASGYGCASLTVNAQGLVTLQGALADATSISHSATLPKSGRWPVYADLYNHQGLLTGWLDLTGTSPKGGLTWITPSAPLGAKVASQAATTALNAFGSVYVPASPAIRLPKGSLDVTVSNSIPDTVGTSVLPNNSLKATSSTNVLTGTILRTSGLMTVTFKAAGQPNVTRIGMAAVLQSSNAAFGSFVGGDGTAGSLILH